MTHKSPTENSQPKRTRGRDDVIARRDDRVDVRETPVKGGAERRLVVSARVDASAAGAFERPVTF